MYTKEDLQKRLKDYPCPNYRFSAIVDNDIYIATFSYDELINKDMLSDNEIKERAYSDNVELRIGNEYNVFDENEFIAAHVVQEIKGCKPDETYVSYIVNVINHQSPETAIMINNKVKYTLKGKFLECFKDKTLDEILIIIEKEN